MDDIALDIRLDDIGQDENVLGDYACPRKLPVVFRLIDILKKLFSHASFLEFHSKHVIFFLDAMHASDD